MIKKAFLLLSLVWGYSFLHAQDSSRRVDVHFRHATLQQAFAGLEKQFGFNFSYNENNIRLYNRDINFALKGATARQVLDKIFSGSPLVWSLRGGLVVLSANPNYKRPGSARGSAEALTGTLADAETAEPVAGATVSAGDRSVLTDEDGRYRLALPAGTYTVTISHMTYGGEGGSRPGGIRLFADRTEPFTSQEWLFTE
ncbi:carboxypeptidase regulatory-like domain-containing protein [Puia sp. P3]|uniref:carboxypeptidase regulatory-like domain-containing protein n=1 Tax=Puia sp. P3 TaxID=3423952 RepID=UPI003D66FCE1